MNIYQQAAKNAKDEGSEQLAERRLWTAVLLQALEDWKSTNLRRKKEAEEFIFKSGPDFSKVCLAAGLTPDSVLIRLQRMKAHMAQPLDRFQYAA